MVSGHAGPSVIVMIHADVQCVVNKREWCECVVSVSYMKSDPPSSAALSGPVRNGCDRI